MSILSHTQSTKFIARFGSRVSLEASLEVTPVGLVAISMLVCGILLSTRQLVGTAIREGKRRSRQPRSVGSGPAGTDTQ